MFMEYNGNIYFGNPETTIEEHWFSVKNDIRLCNPYVKLHLTNKVYKCTYKKEVMEVLGNYRKNLYIDVCKQANTATKSF